MKTIERIKWYGGALLLAFSICIMPSCSSDDEPAMGGEGFEIDESDLKPVEVSDETTTEVLAFWDSMYLSLDYDASLTGVPEEPCFVFNSLEDVKAAFKGNEVTEFPDIDFSKYTLVYGEIGESGHLEIEKSEITLSVQDNGTVQLNLALKHRTGTAYMGPCVMWYWNVYPKFSASKVIVQRHVIDQPVLE